MKAKHLNLEKAIEVHPNLSAEIKGDRLLMEIDLAGEKRLSESGKSTVLVNLGRHGVALPGGLYLQMTAGSWVNSKG